MLHSALTGQGSQILLALRSLTTRCLACSEAGAKNKLGRLWQALLADITIWRASNHAAGRTTLLPDTLTIHDTTIITKPLRDFACVNHPQPGLDLVFVAE